MRYGRWVVLFLAACAADPDTPSGGETDATTDTAAWGDPATWTVYDPVAPNFRVALTDFEGLPVASYRPEPLTALAILLHGTGGDGPNLVDSTETTAVLNALVAQGAGFVAPTSDDRAARVWDTGRAPADNPDVQRLVRLRDTLIAAGTMTAETPIVVWGFSNGGSFASYLSNALPSLGWPVVSVAIHGMTGNGDRYRTPGRVPTWWSIGDNDDKVDQAQGKEQYDDHVGSGEVGRWRPHGEKRLEPLRFMRTGYYERADSVTIFRQAVEGGLVDVDGNRLFAAEELESAINAFMRDNEVLYEKPATAVLKVVFAGHAINGEYAEEEAAFLLNPTP
jgi:predicted esterase